MNRRNFWKVLPVLAFAPTIIAGIKPEALPTPEKFAGPEYYSGGIIKDIQESCKQSEGKPEWTGSMSERDFEEALLRAWERGIVHGRNP